MRTFPGRQNDRIAPSTPARRWIGTPVCLLALTGCAPAPTGPGPFDLDRMVVYPSPPDPARVHYLRSFTGTRDFEPPRGGFDAWLLGERPVRHRQIRKADGVGAVDGKVYAVDQRGRALFIFDLTRATVEVVGTTGPGRLEQPRALHISGDGLKYVADMGRKQVVVFDAADEFLTAYGMTDPARTFTPVAATPLGDELFALDIASHRIAVFHLQTNQFLRYVGQVGSEPGQFVFPYDITALDDNGLLVTDFLNTRVQHVDRAGTVRRTFGELGIRHGQFVRPKGIAVGPDGIIYVVDAAFEVVQMFNADGQVLMSLGGPGEQPGDLILPTGVATSADPACIEALRPYAHPDFRIDYLILVASQFGQTPVNVYAFGAFPAGKDPFLGRPRTPRTRPASQPIRPLDGTPTTAPASPRVIDPLKPATQPSTTADTTAAAPPGLDRPGSDRRRDPYSHTAHATRRW